jgi:GNAT superfamily N-acetyltransferase
VSVRLAGPEDAGTVAELLCGFRDHMGRDWPLSGRIRELVDELILRDDTEYLLAGDDGVAQLRYRYGVWLDGLDCCLEDLFVRDAARGRGLGRALVEATIERARERGCKRIELDVDPDNPAALGLYESAGFVHHGLFMRRRL